MQTIRLINKSYSIELADESRFLLVAHIFNLLFVFGNLGGSGALASFELGFKLRDKRIEGIFELLLSLSVSPVSSVKLAIKIAVVGAASAVGSVDEISLHLSEVRNLIRAEVSTAKNIEKNVETYAKITLKFCFSSHVIGI